jgi:SAM-dependent methyltransferase
MIVAPRGEFWAGALRFERRRKRIYWTVARAFDLYHGVTWQASTEHEAADIVREGFGEVAPSDLEKGGVLVAGSIVVAADLARMRSPNRAARSRKEPGSFDFVFSSHCLEYMGDREGALRQWWRLVIAMARLRGQPTALRHESALKAREIVRKEFTRKARGRRVAEFLRMVAEVG